MSIKNEDATTSDAPESGPRLSPFSATPSILSENTTDEPPDLGAFSSVFRTLASFQQQPPVVHQRTTSHTTTSKLYYVHEELSDTESDAAHSTVWNHDPIRSYLSSDNAPDGPRPIAEEEDPVSLTEGEDDKILARSGPGPSLGILDSALYFLANERAKLASSKQRDTSTSDQQDSKVPWRRITSPRRRRRRKRKLPKAEPAGVVTIAPTPDSSVDLSSSPDSRNQIASKSGILRYAFSRSTPNLLAQTAPVDPAFEQLHELASKLITDFPENTRALSRLPRMSTNPLTDDSFADPRFTLPSNLSKRDNSPLFHVFIDHSNILIGFLSFLKRSPTYRQRRLARTHLSHAALTLILERGRLVTRRVMAASSPLYQPMDTAEQLGYEVHIFMRVPQLTNDIPERTHKVRRSSSSNHGPSEADLSAPHAKSPPRGRTGHGRAGSGSKFLPFLHLPHHHNSSNAHSNSDHSHSHHNGTPSSRPRYREQGVDELLQLKLHQSIIDAERPPPGSTIILATGDGNMGEFNEDGFVGCVRSALKKGWKVELYAWRECLSRVWEKEFGNSEWKDRFRIIGLEKYGGDLLLV